MSGRRRSTLRALPALRCPYWRAAALLTRAPFLSRRELWLHSNQLATLPPSLFAGLGNLT